MNFRKGEDVNTFNRLCLQLSAVALVVGSGSSIAQAQTEIEPAVEPVYSAQALMAEPAETVAEPLTEMTADPMPEMTAEPLAETSIDPMPDLMAEPIAPAATESTAQTPPTAPPQAPAPEAPMPGAAPEPMMEAEPEVVPTPAPVQPAPAQPVTPAPVQGQTSPRPIGGATRTGPSYIGIGGNIGIGDGDTALGDGSFAVFSKVGITRNLSIRPAILINDNPTILIPVTFDFIPFVTDVTEDVSGALGFRASPYVGAGAAISTGDDGSVDFLVSGGVDIPLGSNFTATAGLNVSLFDNPAVGLLLGAGFNF